LTISGAYDILALDPRSATPDDVHAAFHKLVLANHPDTFLDPVLKSKATDKMIELNEAYATIRAAGFPRLVPTTQPPPSVHATPPRYGARRARTAYWEADGADTAASPWRVRWEPHPDEWGQWQAPPDALDRLFEHWLETFGVAGVVARFVFRIVDSVVQTVVVPILIGTLTIAVLFWFMFVLTRP
jgi:DnaJ domain